MTIIGIIQISALIISLPVLYVYHRYAKRRWIWILDASLDYHRNHLSVMQKDHSLSDKSRELARGMLWILDKQLMNDLRAGHVNLRGVLRSILGMGTSLHLLGEVYYQIIRYRWHVDDRVPRLLNTLTGTCYRYFLVHSSLSVVALLYMDLECRILMTGVIKKGSRLLYRDLERERMALKN
ncbi:MAG: hypothetical protein CVV44_07125 [Spirochaetae bacterium HGW-Spirochaetae-1]|jgi:hypothetical protein|nr:MAG: hypothetical protein CVV44_07125 [Spirochaetae bacterium HGW-Spirochaetae-1]